MFWLALSVAAAAAPAAVCPGGTTPGVNACLMRHLDQAETRLRRYFAAASGRARKESPIMAARLQTSEKAFEAYREAECGAVFGFWGGTIRTSMELECRILITDERTHTLWQNWLRYPDSTPPILPEPPLVHCERLRCGE